MIDFQLAGACRKFSLALMYFFKLLLNYHLLHNVSVGVAFIGTVLVVVEVLREMGAIEIDLPQNLDIPGFALVIVGSIVASWTAKKMDKKDEET